MRALMITCLVLALAGCAATTAQERSDLHTMDAVLGVMTGIVGIATGDPLAFLYFINAGIDGGLAVSESPGSGAQPGEQTPSGGDR